MSLRIRHVQKRIPSPVWFVIVAVAVVGALALIVPKADSGEPSVLAGGTPQAPAALDAGTGTPNPTTVEASRPAAAGTPEAAPAPSPSAASPTSVASSELTEQDVRLIVRSEIEAVVQEQLDGRFEARFWEEFSKAFDDRFSSHFWAEFETAFADEFQEAFWDEFGAAFEAASRDWSE